FSASNLGFGAGPPCAVVTNGSVSAAATAEAISKFDFTSGLLCLRPRWWIERHPCGHEVYESRFARLSTPCEFFADREAMPPSDGRELVPRAQRLGDAPRLRDAPARGEGRVPVEDLGDGAEAGVGEMIGQRRQERARRARVSIHAEVGQRERTEEP